MFQKKIVEKYLSKLDKELLEQKYDLFCSIFKNEKKIENIRNSKEEQYQEGFIRDLFVSVLGYTIKPEENYNILTELKNEVANKSNSKKSDGAICEENNENKIRAVIELKGTDTTDLDKVAFQAFSYKNFHNECNYVIVSNFERLRIYVETQIEFEEFNLFALSFERFCILYLLLELNQLKADIPLRLKHETLSEEKQITDNFYADYSTFKRLLFEDLCENNLQSEECHADSENRHAELISASGDDGKINKLLLFKKTQKLLDRILFILFCEDRNLLPANSVLGIIKRWEAARENFLEVPLYNLFKQYFNWIDKGFENPNDKNGSIFAYNGGLFKTDEVLDNIKVGDDVLFIHTKRLADYDFESQISVDILGRIFENSLTEIEEVQKEIEAEKTGEKVENNNVGKRKKDGVFYTPEYITKYIVENTIGKLCEEKREELKINDEEFSPEKSVKTGDDKKTVAAKQKITAELDERLENYRKWLLDLKILDPACGSGAFLNAALQQLKIEHTLIDYYWSNIHAGELNFTEIENTILENNLYGVDINEESVEIAKLSLWLHTAKKNRKLTTLNGKIKCGNSLIDDSAIAGEKAFNWEKEFPEVFEKGGFDVVIGNPPYVPTEFISDCDKNFYEKTYKSAYGRINIYPIFYEKGIELLKENGLLGFITPYTILKNQYYIEARKFILNETKIKTLVDFANIQVFRDATVDSIVFIMEKGKSENNSFKYINKIEDFSGRKFNEIEINQNDILNVPDYSFSNLGNSFNFEKLYEDIIEVKNIVDFKQGIITGSNKKFLTKESSEKCKKVLSGSDFNRYKLSWSGDYVIYDEQELHRPRKPEIFEKDEKILLRQTGSFPICMIDTNSFYTLDTVHNGSLINANFNLKYIMCLLNSNLLRFIYESSINETGKVFAQVKIIYIDPLPIKNISLEAQQPFIALADKMLSLNENFQKKSGNFIKVVKQTFALEKVSAKMESFYELDFDGFVKELKQKITPKLKLEWLEVFEDTKKSLQEIQSQIAATDKEINALVYKLYDLTEEEIKIVEGR